MDENTVNGLIVAFVFFVSLLLLIHTHTAQHETTHAAINTQHNINSTIEYYLDMPILGGRTIADLNYTNGTWKNGTADINYVRKYEKTKPYHLLNEIIGYNILTISLSMMFSSVIISMTLLLIFWRKSSNGGSHASKIG